MINFLIQSVIGGLIGGGIVCFLLYVFKYRKED